jgi:phosphoglycerate dehydrogenase-like enzyme
MRLFLYEPAYRRMQAQIQAICPQAQPILLTKDGQIHQDGKLLRPEEVRADVAYISVDIFFASAAKTYFSTIENGPKVKWMQCAAAGFDNPFILALARKAELYSNSNCAAKGIAEFVMGTVMDHYQPNPARRARQAAHEWRRLAFRDIAGTSWMIVGYGNIGQETGKRAMAFEAHVTGVRRNPRGGEPADAMIRPQDMLPLLPRMDVVVLTADSNETTRHIVNAPFLAAMKPGSVLVNIARGALVDETALLHSLERGVPECAILDVFETEPLPADSPFWDHPRVRVTAHCAASSPLMEPRSDAVFLRNLGHYVNNEPLELLVKFD